MEDPLEGYTTLAGALHFIRLSQYWDKVKAWKRNAPGFIPATNISNEVINVEAIPPHYLKFLPFLSSSLLHVYNINRHYIAALVIRAFLYTQLYKKALLRPYALRTFIFQLNFHIPLTTHSFHIPLCLYHYVLHYFSSSNHLQYTVNKCFLI